MLVNATDMLNKAREGKYAVIISGKAKPVHSVFSTTG